MIKWIGALAVGVALGIAGVLLAQRVLDDEPAPALQPIGTPVPAPPPPPSTSGTEAVSLARIQELSHGFERNAALHDLLQAADASSIETLLVEAAAPDLAWSKWTIYSRYVDLAPRAALNRLVSENPNHTGPLYGLLFSWALKDLDAALAFAETLETPLRTQAGKNLLHTLGNLSDARQNEIARRLSVDTELTRMRTIAEAAADPANAWQQALAMEAGQTRNQTLSAIAWKWFDQDTAAALSALNSVAGANRRDASRQRQRMLERWAGVDWEAAIQWSVSQPASAKRTSLVADVAAFAAKDSPVGVLEFAKTLDPKERREVARKALEVWADSDPHAALSALEQMADPRLTQLAQHNLVDRWAKSDPLKAFEWARTRPTSKNRTRALTTVLSKVAQSEPAQAMGLAEDLDAAARSNVIEAVLWQWGYDDPRAAAAWLDASPHNTPGAVAAVARGYVALDAEETVDWLLRQPVEAQRRSVSMVASRLAEDSPESALRLIDRIDDPAATTVAGIQLMSRWARDDPRAAVRVIAGMKDRSRPQLYRTAFSAWSDIDPEAASAFIGRIPASDRDAATNGVMQQALLDGDVQSAEELFDTLVDTKTRARAATTMYLHLSPTDPKRAERYREMSDMTIAEDGSMTVTIPNPGL